MKYLLIIIALSLFIAFLFMRIASRVKCIPVEILEVGGCDINGNCSYRTSRGVGEKRLPVKGETVCHYVRTDK